MESRNDRVRALETQMTKTDSHPPQSDIYSTPQIQSFEYQNRARVRRSQREERVQSET